MFLVTFLLGDHSINKKQVGVYKVANTILIWLNFISNSYYKFDDMDKIIKTIGTPNICMSFLTLHGNTRK
uniref:Uncharacterized protein n=1 Tax=Arundo donax TaxID=35708 RepID=A0A0A8ZPG3_ARUDO